MNNKTNAYNQLVDKTNKIMSTQEVRQTLNISERRSFKGQILTLSEIYSTELKFLNSQW